MSYKRAIIIIWRFKNNHFENIKSEIEVEEDLLVRIKQDTKIQEIIKIIDECKRQTEKLLIMLHYPSNNPYDNQIKLKNKLSIRKDNLFSGGARRNRPKPIYRLINGDLTIASFEVVWGEYFSEPLIHETGVQNTRIKSKEAKIQVAFALNQKLYELRCDLYRNFKFQKHSFEFKNLDKLLELRLKSFADHSKYFNYENAFSELVIADLREESSKFFNKINEQVRNIKRIDRIKTDLDDLKKNINELEAMVSEISFENLEEIICYNILTEKSVDEVKWLQLLINNYIYNKMDELMKSYKKHFKDKEDNTIPEILRNAFNHVIASLQYFSEGKILDLPIYEQN